MKSNKTELSSHVIPSTMFDKCEICGTEKKAILELYPTRKNGAYYLDKFENFLRDNHNISIKEYCVKYLKFEWPKCPVSGEETGYRLAGYGIQISKFKQGKLSKEHCESFKLACEKFSEERVGAGNPMFGKRPWNKDIDPESDFSKRMRELKLGTKMSEESKVKMREARAKSPIKARHTQKHSKESIQLMREATAKRYSDGTFKKESSIHIIIRAFLEELGLAGEFKEEFQIDYFSMDFAFPNLKFAIECQGTYFHIDPRVYPNGPKDAIQRRNFGRDIIKRKHTQGLGWETLEIWETEINNGEFKEILKCKLRELSILKE